MTEDMRLGELNPFFLQAAFLAMHIYKSIAQTHYAAYSKSSFGKENNFWVLLVYPKF